jgi:transposase
MLVRKEPYKDLGGDYFDKLRPAATTKRLVGRLEQLGYKVTLEAQAAADCNAEK